MLSITGFLSGALKKVEAGAEAAVQWAIADVDDMFNAARAGIASASFLPTPVKAALTSDVTQAQSDLAGLAGLAGTEVGTYVGEAVDGATNLADWLTAAIGGQKAVTALSAAERTDIALGIKVVQAQLTTYSAQIQAGITPASAANSNAAQSGATSQAA